MRESPAMSFRDRLTLAQRIVLVIAAGAAARVFQWWLLDNHGSDSGWFNYAPNSGLALSPTERFSPFIVAIGSLALLAGWATISLWLLAPPRHHEDGR
jgi:hypothetical protein